MITTPYTKRKFSVSQESEEYLKTEVRQLPMSALPLGHVTLLDQEVQRCCKVLLQV